MIEEHNPIDIESFSNEIISSLKRETKPKILKNLMEVNDLSAVGCAKVYVTVVCVFFDGIEEDQGTVL